MTESQAFEKYNEGRAHMDADKLDEAIACFQESLTLLPHFKTLELLGECLFRAGRPMEAITPLAAATTLNESVRAPVLLAEVFLALNQRDDALRATRIALRQAPQNKKAKSLLAALENKAECSKLGIRR